MKSPNKIYGEGSCCSKLSKFWEFREKDGGIYTSLSRVTETAVACSSVCKSSFLCGKDDDIQILRHHQRASDNQYEHSYIN